MGRQRRSPRGGDRLANLDELLRVAGEAGTPAALLERITRADAVEGGDDAPIQLATIHATKGLEADEVYLVGWEEGILPSGQAVEAERLGDTAPLEEERNTAYVALTRARR